MKIITTHFSLVGRARSARPTLAENGSAVVVILILLCIMLLYVAANTATVNWLRGEVKTMDKHQVERLRSSQSATNQPLSK
jgi:uncharacterized membrane protein YvbJ